MKPAPISGRYELEEIIGTGGMSVVYRAWDLKYDREVAVKVLRPEFMEDADFVRRFNHEAQAASQMSHPNIVDMYDVGQDGDMRYIVMEYVKGVTLKELIRQQAPLRPQKAVQITLRILAAVDHAHKNHIVHRDIKPQNILVSAEGNVKVADFGIARVINSATGTIDGSVLGSVHYFSPEQANGLSADEKSDLYSVGVVFYEMVTGQVPFEGETPIAVALKHINETPVSAQMLNPDVSKGLDEVITKALEKDADKRYKSAAEMATDLKRAIKMPAGGFVRTETEKIGRAKGGKGRLLKKIVLFAVLAAVLAGCFSGYRIYRRLKNRVPMPALVLTNQEEALNHLTELGLTPVLVEQHSVEIAAGVVIEQQPESGTLLSPGSAVRITVSLGKESVMVPKLLGYSRSEAVHELEQEGLSLGDVKVEVSDEKANIVIGQSPSANEWVAPNTPVTLIVSGASAAMPDLYGLTPELAKKALEAVGFRLGAVTEKLDDAPEGTIIEQSIAADTPVLLGEEVAVTISQVLPKSYYAQVRINLTVPEGGAQVSCMLDEQADGNQREVYKNTLAAGSQVIELALDSYLPGDHLLTVYMGDTLVVEKVVSFAENE